MSASAKSTAPPWWAWYEPPRWFPKWLHLMTCTFCRGMGAHLREKGRAR